MSAERVALIRERINAALQPELLEIKDESHRHAGHAGAKDGGHFRVRVVSAAFTGKAPLARHRMIYAALGDAMRGEIHALTIDASTPDEA